jgi:hypothetical protein
MGSTPLHPRLGLATMRRVLLVFLLIVSWSGVPAAAVAATGRYSVPPPLPAPARIAGHTHDCGGPPPGRCWVQPWVWVVVTVNDHIVHREKSDRHGWFHFTLPAARYHVRIEGVSYSTKTVRAKAGHIVHVRLFQSVP